MILEQLQIEPIEFFPERDHLANDDQCRRLKRPALLDNVRQRANNDYLLFRRALVNHRRRRFRRAAVSDQLGYNRRQIVQPHQNH